MGWSRDGQTATEQSGGWVVPYPVCTEEFGLGKRGKRGEGLGLRAPTGEEVSRRLKALREYRWSSYRCYGGYAGGPDWLESGVLLGRAHRDPKRVWAGYRRDIRNRLTHGVDPSKEERLRDAIAIGAEGFVREIKKWAGGGRRAASVRCADGWVLPRLPARWSRCWAEWAAKCSGRAAVRAGRWRCGRPGAMGD